MHPARVVARSVRHAVARQPDLDHVAPRHQSGLHQHLGAVADAEDRLASLRSRSQLRDQRILRSQRARAHPVLIREAAGQHIALVAGKLGDRPRPAKDLGVEPDALERARGLGLAVHARELHHRHARRARAAPTAHSSSSFHIRASVPPAAARNSASVQVTESAPLSRARKRAASLTVPSGHAGTPRSRAAWNRRGARAGLTAKTIAGRSPKSATPGTEPRASRSTSIPRGSPAGTASIISARATASPPSETS